MAGAGTAPAQDADLITIDNPDDMPLAALVDYASQSLGIQVVYDNELDNKNVTVRPSPVTLPRERLLDFVRSVLRVHGLAIVADEVRSFYRIVPTGDLPRVIQGVQTTGADGGTVADRVLTQVLRVPSGNTKRVAGQLKAFLSSQQSSMIEVPETGVIIVTDFEPVVQRIVRLMELIDAAPEPIETQIIPVPTTDAGRLADQVTEILGARSKQASDKSKPLDVLSDVLADHLVLVGTEQQLNDAMELINDLVSRPTASAPMRSYRPLHISASRLRVLIEQLILTSVGAAADVRLFVDESTNRVYVTASESVHQRVRALMEDSDVPVMRSARPMRTYRPRNRTAAEILETLTHLLEEATVTAFNDTAGSGDGTDSLAPVGRNRRPSDPAVVQVPPEPPAVRRPDDEGSGRRTSVRVEGPDYVLTEDTHTNTIIAIGTPEFHTQLETLVEELDRRRPQVMIEMNLVAVTLSDSLDVGVELQAIDLGKNIDYLLFSSFGLSSVDAMTGQRVLSPGVGVNGVLLSPDETPAILRALATHGDTRVISTPRIVVSDTTTGTLRSVEEAPFTSINASDTVATTSFAGFESAGTTLTVTPRIAEGDHLNLDYNLTFSSFSGASSDATAPPPRTTNSFTATVEVPDGFTVVVGGLEVENDADTVSEVPLLGRIPILGALFQSSTASRTRTRVFAFIRPVILRDDQFADLKLVTEYQLKRAEMENTDYPPDHLMWMR